MTLDATQLKDALVQVFTDGLENGASTEESAEALADAIHDYVTTAVVNGVVVDVVDTGGNPIGTGTQTTEVPVT